MSCIHQDILQNINNRYVLYKRPDETFSIIDKLKRTIVSIEDPVVNFNKLIEILISKEIEIFINLNDLPEAVEKPIEFSANAKTLKIFIKKLYDEKGRETGSIISAITDRLITNYNEKRSIERNLEDYAFTTLYPYEGLNLYTDINTDTISITVIRNINDLKYRDIDPSEAKILDR